MVSRTTSSQGKSASESKCETKKEALYVVKIKRIPYGLFEKQLWEYFTQFGKVVRVRVARSVKTGNHKGWAYVGFEDKEVAEIAAETMDGYLMFEKRLSCHVMKPEDVPRSMKNGPRYLAPPHMKGRAKKEALSRNKIKSAEQEQKSKVRREAALRKRLSKLKMLGVDYELETSATDNFEAVKPTKSAGEQTKEKEPERSNASSPPVQVGKSKTVKTSVKRGRAKVSASKLKRMRK